jgi:hypothetical protein
MEFGRRQIPAVFKIKPKAAFIIPHFARIPASLLGWFKATFP